MPTQTIVGKTTLRLVTGDIADQDTDAVVTAAHWRLNKGAGTDGTIYAIGGSIGGGTSSEVDAYNPATNSWTVRASLPAIRTYLGVRHLQGYREWTAESKAIFLDQNITASTDLKKLKSEFGIERKDIARFLIPYRVRKAASQILDDLELGEDQSFWILGEALARSGIKEYIKLDVDSKSFKVRSFDEAKFHAGSVFGFHKLRRRNTEEIVAEDRLTARFRPTRKMRAAELKSSVAMGRGR